MLAESGRLAGLRLLNMAPILYLDYDGVLHSADVRVTKDGSMQPRIYEKGKPTDRPLFEHAALLARILDAFPDVRISLATSWVRTFGYESAVQQLPQALQLRVVGTIWQGWKLQFPPPCRYEAITIDAEERGVKRWLALDDDVEGWPVDRRHLVVAPKNTRQGLAQPGIAEELSTALELLCAGHLLETRLSKAALLSATRKISSQ